MTTPGSEVRGRARRIAANQDRSLLADLRAVVPAFVAARVLIALGWLMASAVAHRYYGRQPTQLSEGLIAWDGTWYRDIATLGYERLPLEGLRFFPLFPMLGRLFGSLFGVRADVALVALANVAAVGTAVLARRIVRAEMTAGDRKADDVANRAVWAITLFPSAFVLAWAYAESLLLCFAMGALLLARRGKWRWAAVLAAAAALCRPVGIALAPALAVEAVRTWRGSPPIGRLARVVAVFAPIGALGSYLGWVGTAFGDWTLPFGIQGELRGEVIDPASRVLRGFGDLLGPERFGDGLHIPFAVAFVMLTVVTFRRWPACYGVYAVVVLVMALSAANLNSLERYALNAFPLAMTLAVLARTTRLERLGLAICGCGLFSLSALAFGAVYVP
ncbi:MAG: hypothetical protein N2037_12235 [Acidimicrobiales bacterium]|nr:hypothetical protein [Acidimicrobiales bacterium]